MKKGKKTLILNYIGTDYWSVPVYKDQYSRLWKDTNFNPDQPSLHSVSGNEIDGEPCWPIDPEMKYETYPSADEIRNMESKKRQYMMLSRLKQDCDYYLGYGNRYSGHLWARDEKEQIEEMKKIWDSFSDDEKPEWLTLEDIENYEKEMLKGSEKPE